MRRMAGRKGPQDVEHAPSGEPEKSLYKVSNLLLPPNSVVDDHESELKSILTNTSKTEDPRSYLKRNWMTSVTMLDVESKGSKEAQEPPDFAFDPFELFDRLTVNTTKTPSRLSDHMSAWFDDIAEALEHLNGRVVVEGICGELTEIMQQIRCDLIETRSPSDPNHPPFPSRYDRVHLSGVSDYLGGHGSTFLCATPLLSPGESLFFTSTNLRNPMSFNTTRDFTNEYLPINDEVTAERLFRARLACMADFPYGAAEYIPWSALGQRPAHLRRACAAPRSRKLALRHDPKDGAAAPPSRAHQLRHAVTPEHTRHLPPAPTPPRTAVPSALALDRPGNPRNERRVHHRARPAPGAAPNRARPTRLPTAEGQRGALGPRALHPSRHVVLHPALRHRQQRPPAPLYNPQVQADHPLVMGGSRHQGAFTLALFD